MTKKKTVVTGGRAERMARIAEIIDKNKVVKIRVVAYFYDSMRAQYLVIPGEGVSFTTDDVEVISNLSASIRKTLVPGERP